MVSNAVKESVFPPIKGKRLSINRLDFIDKAMTRKTSLERPILCMALICTTVRTRCGTDMRLLVPGGEDALHYAKPRLQALFARMHLLPDRAAGVSLKCEVRCLLR